MADVSFAFICWINLFLVLMFSLLVSNHLEQKHLREIFLPAVRGILFETGSLFAESGYEVELLHKTNELTMLATRFLPNDDWFLRFTLITNDEVTRVTRPSDTATEMMSIGVSTSANTACLDGARMGV